MSVRLRAVPRDPVVSAPAPPPLARVDDGLRRGRGATANPAGRFETTFR